MSVNSGLKPNVFNGEFSSICFSVMFSGEQAKTPSRSKSGCSTKHRQMHVLCACQTQFLVVKKCIWKTLSSFKAVDNKLVTWDFRQKFYFEIIMLFSEKSDMS